MFKNRVALNASWLIGCRIFQTIFAMVINIFTARYLGPSNYGLLSYAASIVAFITPIVNLGINNVLVNEIVKYPRKEGETLGTSILLTIGSSAFSIFTMWIIMYSINPADVETRRVCVLYCLLLIAQAFELVQYWFQAKLWSKYTSISVLMAYILISVYKIYLLRTNKDVYWFALSNTIDYSLIALFLFVIYRKKGGSKFSFSLEAAKRIFMQGKHYIIAGVMGVALSQTAVIMLKMIYDVKTVGIYSTAFSICGFTTFVFSAIIDSMRPLILEQKAKENPEYRNSISRLFGIVLYLSLLQSIFIALFAAVCVNIMYGKSFSDSIIVLRIIVWYTPFSYSATVRSIWILAENKQRYLWKISLYGLLFNFICNIIFIPKFGAVGAAISMVCTQAFSGFLINYMFKPLREINSLMLKGFDIRWIFKKSS